MFATKELIKEEYILLKDVIEEIITFNKIKPEYNLSPNKEILYIDTYDYWKYLMLNGKPQIAKDLFYKESQIQILAVKHLSSMYITNFNPNNYKIHVGRSQNDFSEWYNDYDNKVSLIFFIDSSGKLEYMIDNQLNIANIKDRNIVYLHNSVKRRYNIIHQNSITIEFEN